MAVLALLASVIGNMLSVTGAISLPQDIASVIPMEKRARFVAVWFAHATSYLVGIGGAGILCYWVWRARGRPSVLSTFPKTRAGWLRAAALMGAIAIILWFPLHSH